MGGGKLALRSGALLAGLTLWLCAAAATAQSYNTYKSWLVACDNTLQCEAKAFDQEAGGRAVLSIAREAGPRGTLHATISADSPFDRSDIMLDGHTLPLPAGWHRADAAVDGT